ncbi:hypothetical protein [Asinibacterium sp. OR53]|jgi:hypothetical protein|uniref:hypothetical protein n=1 Tax=Asinibacterium sp. OR53 TaxID=925409 RepID=UPI000479DBE4|nr:hypothetical protein [Asinibacterium sp. OR53]
MKKTITIGCIALLFFTACKKELSSNLILYPNHPLNDTAWMKNATGSATLNELAQLMFPNLTVDSFDCSKTDTLSYGDSLSIVIPGSSFTYAGGGSGGSGGGGGSNVCSGPVRIEFFRLKTKGDFIKFFKPTVSNGYLLETGGGIFIRVTQNGHELKLLPGATITIRFSDTQDPKPNMQVFYAAETIPYLTLGNIDTMHTWLRDLDTTWIKTWSKPNSTNTSIVTGYELVSKNLRWISACRYTDSTLPSTKITAVLPPNFTNRNTVVFAVFANQKTVVRLKDDFDSRSFATWRIPIGSKITLVSISRIGTDLYLGTKNINDVGTVTHYVIDPPVQKNLTEILQYLNSL